MNSLSLSLEKIQADTPAPLPRNTKLCGSGRNALARQLEKLPLNVEDFDLRRLVTTRVANMSPEERSEFLSDLGIDPRRVSVIPESKKKRGQFPGRKSGQQSPDAYAFEEVNASPNMREWATEGIAKLLATCRKQYQGWVGGKKIRKAGPAPVETNRHKLLLEAFPTDLQIMTSGTRLRYQKWFRPSEWGKSAAEEEEDATPESRIRAA